MSIGINDPCPDCGEVKCGVKYPLATGKEPAKFPAASWTAHYRRAFARMKSENALLQANARAVRERMAALERQLAEQEARHAEELAGLKAVNAAMSAELAEQAELDEMAGSQ